MEDRTESEVVQKDAKAALMSRRDFLKAGARWGVGLLGLAALGGGYATNIEPRWLEVVRTRLPLPGLPAEFHGMRIAHFSDVHAEFHFGVRRLRKLVQRIAAEEPDMVCFTGDLVNRSSSQVGAGVSEAFATLEAPLGKYAVLGNHDYYEDDGEAVAQVLEKGGFRCLRNEWVHVATGDARIRIAGVEDVFRGKPDLDAAFKDAAQGESIVLLAHTPDYAQHAAAYPLQLQLSGHSHGGQVRLPFIGPLATVAGARLYPDGLSRPEENFLLYTNRGIGVTNLPVRFMCRPELTVHTLVQA